MGRAYGTPIPQTTDGPQCEAAQRSAEDKLQRQYQGTPPEVLWRVEAVSYAACSLDVNGGEHYYSTDPRLEVFALEVLRWTEHGATLRETTGARNRWVNLQPGAKQYASRTVAEAVEQFANRRRAQIYILQRQLARAERELALTLPKWRHVPNPTPRPQHYAPPPAMPRASHHRLCAKNRGNPFDACDMDCARGPVE